MNHWAVKYIGAPWKFGGNDFSGFDCWGLFRHIQKWEFGIDVPEIALPENNPKLILDTFENHEQRQRWVNHNHKPNEGDAALLSTHKRINHIGVWVEGSDSGIIHCINGLGVIFTKRAEIEVSKWNIHGFCSYE